MQFPPWGTKTEPDHTRRMVFKTDFECKIPEQNEIFQEITMIFFSVKLNNDRLCFLFSDIQSFELKFYYILVFPKDFLIFKWLGVNSLLIMCTQKMAK